MIRHSIVVASLALALAQACSARVQPPESTAPSLVTLSIVGTNDLHGGIFMRDNRGGLALLGGYLKNLRAVRARDGGAVLPIDAGDMFQGTLESNLTEGAPVVAAYNALGYAAAAVGNHEFDFGPVGPAATPASPKDDPQGALKARAASAKFPFLAANLLVESTGQPVAWPNVKPSVVVEAAGVKVGIIGLMTSEALSATSAANVRGLRVAPLAETTVAHATKLRAQGATVIVVAAHAGGRCTRFEDPSDLSSCDPAAEIFALARALPKGLVDAIVGGHSHAGVAHEVEGIAITESLSGGRAFGRIDLIVDRRSHRVVSKRIFAPRDLCALENAATHTCDPAASAETRVQATYEGAPIEPDPAIVRELAPALADVAALKARPIGITLDTAIRRSVPESPLGNLFTDALLASVKGADVSLHNNSGGLRADLPQGALTYGSIYEVMPFDNAVISIRITGRQLETVFAAHIQKTRRVLGFSGVRATARCNGSAIDVVLTRPSGVQIKDDEVLTVVVSDFLATGGDGILGPVLPPAGFSVPADSPLARDVLAEYLQRRGGQLREAELFDPNRPRLEVPGDLPVSCPASVE